MVSKLEFADKIGIRKLYGYSKNWKFKQNLKGGSS